MKLEELLQGFIKDDKVHAKWLNTLSMMENAGARKIKACEHPIFVNEVILKHASEEARHAYYLKKQISKVCAGACPTYEAEYLLAPEYSKHYLDALDIHICRFLKKRFHYQVFELKYAAYLLVTYAIEVRAEALYPIYKQVLESANSKVKVNTIIAEEAGHLEEMRRQILDLFKEDQDFCCSEAVQLEQALYEHWLAGLCKENAIQSQT